MKFQKTWNFSHLFKLSQLHSALLGELLNLELETRGVTCHLIEGGKEYKVNSVIQVTAGREF